MKKLLIILLSALSLTSFAQSKKTVAVLNPICRDNSVNVFFQQMVRGAMESAVTASEEYEAYDRSAFDMIQKEQAFQRTGAVSDSQIKKMGEMAGVDYVLVSEVSAYEGYMSTIVKILNVTTGKYDKSVDDYMQLSPESVNKKCKEIASSLFGSGSLKKQAFSSVNKEMTTGAITSERIKQVRDSLDKVEIRGYRVQVYNSNQPQTAMLEAKSLGKQLKADILMRTYVICMNSFWKVRVGDFCTYDVAHMCVDFLRQLYPTLEIYVVGDKIRPYQGISSEETKKIIEGALKKEEYLTRKEELLIAQRRGEVLLDYPIDTICGIEVYRYKVPHHIGIYKISVVFGVTQTDIINWNPQLKERGIHYDELLYIPTGRPIE